MTRQYKTGLNAPAVSVNGTAVSVEGHTHAGGGGAPTDATYVVTSSNSTLTNERVLTGGGTTYITITDNGSSTVTVAVDATSANTASKVVARDSSGNFSAGTITAALSGNASSATALSSSRTLALTGDITGSVSSDLSSGASISTAIASGVIVDADINASAAIADTKLATISTAGKVSNTATTATSANTASAIVARDASGNFTAGTITAALTGNASSATTLQTSRNINGVAFNGSADITVQVPVSTGITGLGSNVATFLATPSSSNLISAVTDETGTGSLVFATSPTLVTPTLGAASATTVAASGIITALNFQPDVTTLGTTGTINIDFSGAGFRTQAALTGNITYTASNYAAGRSITIRVTNGTTLRTLAFPTNWKFLNGSKPASIAASKVGVLTVTSFGTTEADCVAAWSVEL